MYRWGRLYYIDLWAGDRSGSMNETAFTFDTGLKDPIDGEVREYQWGKGRFALKETGRAWVVTDSPIDLHGDVDAQLSGAPDP